LSLLKVFYCIYQDVFPNPSAKQHKASHNKITAHKKAAAAKKQREREEHPLLQIWFALNPIVIDTASISP
jgi:hypothetical protein